jgi:hypothetical protein
MIMIKTIRIDQIVRDPRLQHRPVDSEYLRYLSAEMRAGTELPPVSIINDTEKYWLYDGFARVGAARKCNRTTINADIYDGDYRAAFLASLGVNHCHGYRRDAESIRTILSRCLLDPTISALPDSDIARLCNVRVYTVASFRKHKELHVRELPGVETEEPAGPNREVDKTNPIRKARSALVHMVRALDNIGYYEKLMPELSKINEVVELL